MAVAEPEAILGPPGGTLPEGMCQWPLVAPSTKPAGCHVDITPEERAEIYDFIQAKMKPQPLRIRADIQVTCVKYEGIEAVRAALVSARARARARAAQGARRCWRALSVDEPSRHTPVWCRGRARAADECTLKQQNI